MAVRFSLPTIAGELPQTTGARAPAGTPVIAEDDWRQIELVTASQLPIVRASFAAIRDIRAAGTESGFEDIHVRVEPRLPLAGFAMTEGQVERAFASETVTIGGLAVAGSDSSAYLLDGVVSCTEDSTTVYVHYISGEASVIGANRFSTDRPPDNVQRKFQQFARDNDLWVVDWLSPNAVSPTPATRTDP